MYLRKPAEYVPIVVKFLMVIKCVNCVNLTNNKNWFSVILFGVLSLNYTNNYFISLAYASFPHPFPT